MEPSVKKVEETQPLNPDYSQYQKLGERGIASSSPSALSMSSSSSSFAMEEERLRFLSEL
jgi:hypothetical protein